MYFPFEGSEEKFLEYCENYADAVFNQWKIYYDLLLNIQKLRKELEENKDNITIKKLYELLDNEFNFNKLGIKLLENKEGNITKYRLELVPYLNFENYRDNYFEDIPNFFVRGCLIGTFHALKKNIKYNNSLKDVITEFTFENNNLLSYKIDENLESLLKMFINEYENQVDIFFIDGTYKEFYPSAYLFVMKKYEYEEEKLGKSCIDKRYDEIFLELFNVLGKIYNIEKILLLVNDFSSDTSLLKTENDFKDVFGSSIQPYLVDGNTNIYRLNLNYIFNYSEFEKKYSNFITHIEVKRMLKDIFKCFTETYSDIKEGIFYDSNSNKLQLEEFYVEYTYTNNLLTSYDVPNFILENFDKFNSTIIGSLEDDFDIDDLFWDKKSKLIDKLKILHKELKIKEEIKYNSILAELLSICNTLIGTKVFLNYVNKRYTRYLNIIKEEEFTQNTKNLFLEKTDNKNIYKIYYEDVFYLDDFLDRYSDFINYRETKEILKKGFEIFYKTYMDEESGKYIYSGVESDFKDKLISLDNFYEEYVFENNLLISFSTPDYLSRIFSDLFTSIKWSVSDYEIDDIFESKKEKWRKHTYDYENSEHLRLFN